MMGIRKANIGDLTRLMEIYREARQIQIDSGNLHQWREGYPPEEVIRQDIENGVCYVVEGPATAMDGQLAVSAAGPSAEIVGAFAFIPGPDPTYAVIEGGEWIEDRTPYAVIHRLGSTKDSRGVAQACFDWCWSRMKNIRIDTHEDNAIMRHCLEKSGFRRCGVIHLLNGDPRIAFQKITPDSESPGNRR